MLKIKIFSTSKILKIVLIKNINYKSSTIKDLIVFNKYLKNSKICIKIFRIRYIYRPIKTIKIMIIKLKFKLQ